MVFDLPLSCELCESFFDALSCFYGAVVRRLSSTHDEMHSVICTLVEPEHLENRIIKSGDSADIGPWGEYYHGVQA